MNCDILFLYARDSEQIKDDLLQQLRGVPIHCICVDDSDFSCRQTLKSPTQIKLQVVFFSPCFLDFLEGRPEEVYESFYNLDPQAIVALFCCGLQEEDIFCYHTAPLKSYSSWPKYEYTTGQNGGSVFSPFFMGLFEEFFPDRNQTSESVVIVPELIRKESSTVYVIFSNTDQMTEDISVVLETENRIEIVPENMTPYVLHFKVPVILLENCEVVEVKVKQTGRVLARKILSVVPDDAANGKESRKSFTKEKTWKILKLEQELRDAENLLSDMCSGSKSSSMESVQTIAYIDDDVTVSLVNMCKKYGLQQLNPFINKPEPPKLVRRASGLRKSSTEEQIKCQQDTDDTYGFSSIHRSVSLPSIMSPNEKYCNQEPTYLQMEFTNSDSQVDSLCSSKRDSVNESNCYVSMKFGKDIEDSLNIAKRGLSRSQQELVEIMHTFKKGKTTISNVEEKFNMWQKKHSESANSSGNDEQIEAPKRYSHSSKDWRRKGIRRSKIDESMDISSASSSRTCTISRSSNSSRSSESEKPVTKISTGWIPDLRGSHTCTLYPDKNSPPPLPTSPKPSLKKGKHVLKKEKSIKRKIGTYVRPVSTELQRNHNKNKDCEDETVQSLIEVCQRYGLQHLSDYFVSGLGEVNAIPDTLSKHGISVNTDENNFLKDDRFHLSPGEWEGEETIPNLQRSLSLPSILDLDKNYDDVRDLEGSAESLNRKCEDYLNTFTSGIYVSIMQGLNYEQSGNLGYSAKSNEPINDNHTFASGIYMSLINSTENTRKQSLQNNCMSKSQEELLNLMYAFKKGEKTISQVEQQFQQWHRLHMVKPSNRDEQLSQLKDQYEKAQKPNKSSIIGFILGIPKSRRKDNKIQQKSSVDNETSIKKKVEQSNRDSKRLSKTSFTSTSSGVSDNSDFSRYCYDNPGYGETQDIIRGSSSSKLYCSSPDSAETSKRPPVPHRPLLTPITMLNSTAFERNLRHNGVSEYEAILATSQPESPVLAKKKPNPPPKPPNVFEKLSGSNSLENGFENSQNKEDKQEPSHEDAYPESPVYIIPNEVYYATSKKKPLSKWSNASCSDHSGNSPKLSYSKEFNNPVSSSCSTTITRPTNLKIVRDCSNLKTDLSEEESSKVKNAIHNQLDEVATHLMEPKKEKEAIFYVTRKWSSFPKLDMPHIPIYLELQELFESQNRSISDSTSSID